MMMIIETEGFRVSSYSMNNGDCIEAGQFRTSTGNGDCTGAGEYRKSRHSSGQANCTEVGTCGRGIAIRDSKLGERSPVLYFSPAAWAGFTAQLKVLAAA